MEIGTSLWEGLRSVAVEERGGEAGSLEIDMLVSDILRETLAMKDLELNGEVHTCRIVKSDTLHIPSFCWTSSSLKYDISP